MCAVLSYLCIEFWRANVVGRSECLCGGLNFLGKIKFWFVYKRY